MQFETLAIHTAETPDPHTGSVNVSMYQTSTFGRDSLNERRKCVYLIIGKNSFIGEKCLAECN
jgi:O-acetylhomoserine/O-acetylserine sulfhydrylase-like pyridoxal-dependent enzyme